MIGSFASRYWIVVIELCCVFCLLYQKLSGFVWRSELNILQSRKALKRWQICQAPPIWWKLAVRGALMFLKMRRKMSLRQKEVSVTGNFGTCLSHGTQRIQTSHPASIKQWETQSRKHTMKLASIYGTLTLQQCINTNLQHAILLLHFFCNCNRGKIIWQLRMILPSNNFSCHPHFSCIITNCQIKVLTYFPLAVLLLLLPVQVIRVPWIFWSLFWLKIHCSCFLNIFSSFQ